MQICYNLLFRAAELEVIPFCREHGIRIICYSPLQQALLTGRWTNPDDVPTYRARSRHFRGDRPKSRHGEAGHEELTFKTIARLQALCDKWEVGANVCFLSLLSELWRGHSLTCSQQPYALRYSIDLVLLLFCGCLPLLRSL